MAERILLIQPRWLDGDKAAAQLQSLHARHPVAAFVLLAAAPPRADFAIEFWPLPALRGGKFAALRAALRTAWRLRRRRFDVAIVLHDEDRVEAGYLESKVWALTARARARRLGDKALRWREELWDKVPLALSAALLRLLIARAAWRERARREKRPSRHDAARRSLEAFVYLQQCERRGGQGGDTLDVGYGDSAFVEAARRLGRASQGVDALRSNFQGFAPPQRFAFITLLDVIERLPEPVAVLSHVRQLLAPGGLCLLRTATKDAGVLFHLDAESATLLARQAGLHIVEIGESLFHDGALEIWLAIDEGEGGA